MDFWQSRGELRGTRTPCGHGFRIAAACGGEKANRNASARCHDVRSAWWRTAPLFVKASFLSRTVEARLLSLLDGMAASGSETWCAVCRDIYVDPVMCADGFCYFR